MKKKVGIIKQVTCIGLVFLLSINSFAAIVSDNDGSAFITKAEFDALKSSFQSQIDSYNQSIDSKIDGAIASYLAGIKLSQTEDISIIATSYWNSRIQLAATNLHNVKKNNTGYVGWKFDYLYHVDNLTNSGKSMGFVQKDGTNFISGGFKPAAWTQWSLAPAPYKYVMNSSTNTIGGTSCKILDGVYSDVQATVTYSGFNPGQSGRGRDYSFATMPYNNKNIASAMKRAGESDTWVRASGSTQTAAQRSFYPWIFGKADGTFILRGSTVGTTLTSYTYPSIDDVWDLGGSGYDFTPVRYSFDLKLNNKIKFSVLHTQPGLVEDTIVDNMFVFYWAPNYGNHNFRQIYASWLEPIATNCPVAPWNTDAWKDQAMLNFYIITPPTCFYATKDSTTAQTYGGEVNIDSFYSLINADGKDLYLQNLTKRIPLIVIGKNAKASYKINIENTLGAEATLSLYKKRIDNLASSAKVDSGTTVTFTKKGWSSFKNAGDYIIEWDANDNTDKYLYWLEINSTNSTNNEKYINLDSNVSVTYTD